MPITEEAPTRPTDATGASKLAFERMVGITEVSGLVNAVRLRCFNAAGAWPDGSLGEAHYPETHLVPLLLRAAMEPGSSVELRGDDYPTPDGTCVRDYVHVMDIAAAHVSAVEYLGDDGESVICNLGSGQGYSNLEIAEMCAEVTGSDIALVAGPRRLGDVPTLIGSFGRARELLGWSPKRDLRTMIEDAWAWHQSHPDGFGEDPTCPQG
jgi:UDP-glucose 4-epimerase